MVVPALLFFHNKNFSGFGKRQSSKEKGRFPAKLPGCSQPIFSFFFFPIGVQLAPLLNPLPRPMKKSRHLQEVFCHYVPAYKYDGGSHRVALPTLSAVALPNDLSLLLQDFLPRLAFSAVHFIFESKLFPSPPLYTGLSR